MSDNTVKKEYKDTLNLPQTEFAMKANLSQREPLMLKFWEDNAVYAQLRKARAGKEKFILNDGPPYANGHLHCGHALNKTLKDIVVKSRSMSGYDAPYVPGWDCHGLPIELNVEKKWGKAGGKLSKTEFREKCREYAREQINIQREEFKRLGVFGDWDNPYATMDYQYEANIIRALNKIIQKGYLSRGFKPVHWCMDCQSALAEAEVEYEDKASMAIDVAFEFDDAKELESRIGKFPLAPLLQSGGSDRMLSNTHDSVQDKVSAIIWTTTPWTLPANEAVALNGKMEYAFVQVPDNKCYLLASDLVEQVMQRYGIEKYTIVAKVLGEQLAGLKLKHPFYTDKRVPIVLGEHVTTEAGTGCVHTAPAHGPDDYLIGKQYNLPVECPVMGSGVYAPSVKILAGIHVSKADQQVVDLLKEHGNLVHFDNISHSYPHCWRHKTAVIFRATPQWFLSFDKPGLKENMLKAIDSVEWLPDWGKARMTKMLEHRPDWCISRQRSWGTPITLLIHKETGDIHPDMSNIMEHVAKKVEEKGIEAWFEWEPKELLGAESEQYEKVQDTLDVWFDSGVVHECVLRHRPELTYPADIYLEGSDQYRGWFNSSLVTSVMLNDEAPFKTVLSHGFTVDAQGKKMSKSLGNYVAPQEIIQSSGADVLRLWAASCDYRTELTLSDEIFKRVSDAYRRIRNTARFLLSNLFDFNPEVNLLPTHKLLALDQWIVLKTAQCQKEIIEAYDTYQFHLIYQKLHNFCAVELGSFYLDIIKDRQYTTPKESLARRSCQTAMFHIVSALVRWLAPILSFTAEEIWQYMPKKAVNHINTEQSVFLTQWYDHPEFFAVASLEKNIEAFDWSWIISVRESVNKELEVQRTAGKIGSGLAANVIFYADETAQKKLSVLGDEWRFVLLTSRVIIKSLAEKTELALACTGMESREENLFLEVFPSPHEKCVRCWHRCEEVGQIAEHPELCSRCVKNISEEGEVRSFA